jgi:hypothetical protein
MKIIAIQPDLSLIRGNGGGGGNGPVIRQRPLSAAAVTEIQWYYQFLRLQAGHSNRIVDATGQCTCMGGITGHIYHCHRLLSVSFSSLTFN